MKVTTEKLPRSLVALDIELDSDQVEKGIERAARRLSQKYNIPGFRKGKAPRFIVENYFGRAALLEEATDDLINKAFQAALDQEKIALIGKADLEAVNFSAEPYSFRVTVPVAPTVSIGDYRALRSPLAIEEVSDEDVEMAMRTRRDKHAVLRELDEPRPAREGDEMTAELEVYLDGQPFEPRAEGEPLQPATLILEPGRLVPGLYEGLVGAEAGQAVEVPAQMPADHANEQLRGREVTFVGKVLGIKERIPADWDELPTLEEFEGTLEELREKTRAELAESAKNVAERSAADEFTRQLIEQSEFDIPDALVEREADAMLQQEEQQFTRYGVKPEQIYEYRGQRREDLLEQNKPEAERRIRVSLALQELIRQEGITISDDEVQAEVDRTVVTYAEERQESIRSLLNTSLRSAIADTVLDKKLRAHLLLLGAGQAPSQQEQPADAAAAPEA